MSTPLVGGVEPGALVRGCALASPDMANKLAQPNNARASPLFGMGLLRILFIADFLHPLDGFATHRILDGDMGHRRGRRSAVPVLDA
jgi:hypothetical protein